MRGFRMNEQYIEEAYKDKVKELFSALFASCAMTGKIEEAALSKFQTGLKFAHAVREEALKAVSKTLESRSQRISPASRNRTRAR